MRDDCLEVKKWHGLRSNGVDEVVPHSMGVKHQQSGLCSTSIVETSSSVSNEVYQQLPRTTAAINGTNKDVRRQCSSRYDSLLVTIWAEG